jgi:DNA-binding NarL/FixJ family response regulator
MTTGTARAVATAKNVWIIENNETLRLSQVLNLERRGFHVKAFESRDQVRQEVIESPMEVDVAVLDVNLEDKDETTTGLDAGEDIVENQPALPPKRIVYSDHTGAEYYEAAAKSGVDDYIPKATPNGDILLYNQVRTSGLVRALSPVRAAISEKIERIAEQNLTPIEEARKICLEVIAPEVNVCLDVPCIFLLSRGPNTEVLGHESAPGVEAFLKAAQVQDKIFAEKGKKDSKPLSLTTEDLNTPNGGVNESFKQLQRSAFLPLFDENDLRLSIGILSAPLDDMLFEEKDPLHFARNLIRELAQPIVKQFKYLEHVKTIIENTKLKHTSGFCLYVGETQINALEESLEQGEIEDSNACFRKLKRLADDLRATGIEFSRMIELPRKEYAGEAQTASAREVVSEAWHMIKARGHNLELRQSGPNVEVTIPRQDLLIAALRMLEWLAQRQDKVSTEAPQAVEVVYAKERGRAAISFKDYSHRLGRQIRRRLFEPFTQGTTTSANTKNQGDTQPGLYLPLYLAKTLLTVKNRGSLEDRTEDLTSEHGHCFQFTFPTEEDSIPAASAG